MTWYKVFDTLDEAYLAIPKGQARMIVAENTTICLANTFRGKLIAVQDRCPHAGASLSNGKCNYLDEIVCPLHHYRFSLHFGDEATGKRLSIRKYPIEFRNDGIYVGV